MADLPAAFYVPRDDGWFESTAHTTGPWDPGSQHAGPPSALLGGSLEEEAGLPLARVTLEILRPVPVAPLRVETAVDRGGRRVTLVSGTLSDDQGPCVVARAWGIRRAPVGTPVVAPPDPPLPSPDDARHGAFDFELPVDVGWHTAMDLRFVSGSAFAKPGPGVAWSRPNVAIVEGREVRPIERVLAIADAGNGVSAEANPLEHLFINTELTVHLHRQPEGEWVGIDAHSVYEPDGVGAAFSVLHDERGPIGRGAQALYLDTR